MKKIFALCLIAMMAFLTPQVTAQSVKLVPTVTIANADCVSTNNTKTYDRTITGNYNWSVHIYYNRLSGTSDSCNCYLQESVDGTNYLTVVGSAKAAFGAASGNYIWSGGTGNLPLTWAPNYLRVSCTHKNTGYGKATVKLQLKNK